MNKELQEIINETARKFVSNVNNITKLTDKDYVEIVNLLNAKILIEFVRNADNGKKTADIMQTLYDSILKIREIDKSED